MKKAFILLSFVMILLGCEKTIEVEKVYNWTEHKDFKYANVAQLNSYANDDQLFLLNYKWFNILNEDDELMVLSTWFNLPSDKKLPICSDFFMMYNTWGSLMFKPTANSINAYTSLLFHLNDLDKDFSYFEFVSYYLGECALINQNNQVLVPYVTRIESQSQLKVALIDISVEYGIYDTFLDTTSVKLIEIPTVQNYVLSTTTYKKNFFVTAGNSVFRINEKGDVIEVLDHRLYNIVELEGTLYGVSEDYMYHSSDEGLTWIQSYKIPTIWNIRLTKLDNKIIGYLDDKLYKFEINEGGLEIFELDNDGLEGKSITSLSKFNDKIYATSLSGVYYKSANDFFDSVIED